MPLDHYIARADELEALGREALETARGLRTQARAEARLAAGDDLTTEEAAAVLGIATSTVHDWARELGVAPAIRGDRHRPSMWSAAGVRTLLTGRTRLRARARRRLQ